MTFIIIIIVQYANLPLSQVPFSIEKAAGPVSSPIVHRNGAAETVNLRSAKIELNCL